MEPTLLSLITNPADYQKLDDYLSHSHDLSGNLTACDGNGMTALQVAVTQGSFKTVQVLLSFDASIAAKTGGKNVVEYAKDLMNNKPGEEERKKVYALLKSRGQWQNTAAKTQGVLFARSMKTIVDAVDKIKGAPSKSGVLFLGITGEGKSTFINYLSGVDYKRERKNGKTRVIPTTGSEIAKVGDTTTSETLLPQIVASKNPSEVWVDLPGFEDTRGTAEEICAAATICMLTKQLSSIQSVLLICSWRTLTESRMVNYRKAAENIGGMIRKDPKTAENVILLVTKPYEGGDKIEICEVLSRLNELKKDEHWDKLSPMIKREDVDDGTWKKYCLKGVTEAILSNEDHIVIADVLVPEARSDFQKAVGKLSNKQKMPDQFDFANYSRFMNLFQIVMENMIVNYNDLARKRKSQEDKIQDVRKSIQELEKEIKQLEDSIAQSEKQKNEPFTSESFDEKIQEEKKKLTALRNKMLDQNESLRRVELQSMIKTAQRSNIPTSGERLIDTVTQAWFCEKTEERTETVVKDTGQRVTVDGVTYRVVDIDQKTIPGKETTVSEPVNYPSSVPIKRYKDRSQGGTFVATGFTEGALKLAGTFTSLTGARGSVALNVDIYADLKDIPEIKEQMNRLNLEIDNAQAALSKIQSERIPLEEVDESSERLRKLELEKIATVGNHERTQAICEMQISINQSQLAKVREKFAELNKQQAVDDDELADLTLQLEVNRDLFDKLLGIIKVMNFKGPVIDEFLNLQ